MKDSGSGAIVNIGSVAGITGSFGTAYSASMTSNPLMKEMTKRTMDTTVLLRRAGKAEEIAFTALFLASDESSYTSGTDIVVDGGWFSSAPYLGNERSHHMLALMKTKDHIQEFMHHFR